MLHPSHHTQPEASEQVSWLAQNSWDEEIVPRLPADVQSEARSLKAFVRSRKLRSASDLLRGLLSYVLCTRSLRQLGAWSVLIGLGDLSAPAWLKRLRKAHDWLSWLLGKLVSQPVASPVQRGPQTRGRILLVDASTLPQPGGSGDDWRLHLAYDLVAGRLGQVSITDQQTGESLLPLGLRAGDHAVADRGYGYRKNAAAAFSARADLTTRFTPSCFPLENQDGTRLDIVAWLKAVAGTSPRHTYQQTGWMRWKKEPARRVRVIAYELTPEQAEKARSARLKWARQKGHQLKEHTLFLRGWVLLITTTSSDHWSAEELLRLYRARWQIELVFKRMKQILQLNQIRSQDPCTVEAVLSTLLIGWALHEPEVASARLRLQELALSLGEAFQVEDDLLAERLAEEDELVASETAAEQSSEASRSSISSWTLTRLVLETIRQVVRGSWTLQRLQQCLPRLLRFLRERRPRPQQESLIRAFLLSKLTG